MLSIGKTAHLVGLTIKAIKHYEEIGLVYPSYVNPESGYRFYTQKEQQQLVRIKTLRNFGVSLSDILREGDDQMDRLLKNRKKEIENEINELQGKMEGIDQLLNKGEKEMETRIEESKGFTVRGYEVQGPVSEIPAEWDRLIKEINEKGVVVEESFGVCLKMENDIIHYIAGLKEDLTEGFPDTKEVVIPAGRFIVAKVEGGIPGIPAAYDYIIQMENIKLRDCYDFERYVHPAGVSEDVIEIWMPIE
ncbi:GyrI-like domain-containing protein [Sporosarcina thermotolerans]|uniref:GyrI-like domain-containing protein n=1 Tax=Sporosarcina thermotolerans TaxID=633404 RepID=A0AAW9A6A1_9BACL|nr:GyrI-like domain-containing protein [Sporosarcina thermotolerans]MDW0116817.1 GyrI-like domain-containing protein [Sporosarcina thermotolerans]WHT48992.1 GyrI-like domain-containing protein [Sporosarcina thermotolerans]